MRPWALSRRKSALRRLVGSALRADVRISAREEMGAAGAAMIAAVSIGQYATMQDCVAEWVTPLLGAAELPDSALAAVIDHSFGSYVAARDALRPIWRSLSEMKH
jgi:erythritol kinase (D-erythritol 1-phosphate-forming)